MSSVSMARDLEADLAKLDEVVSVGKRYSIHETIQFATEAATGWPYAIKRAIDAEKEIDRLHNELNILQEQQQRGRGCWD